MSFISLLLFIYGTVHSLSPTTHLSSPAKLVQQKMLTNRTKVLEVKSLPESPNTESFLKSLNTSLKVIIPVMTGALAAVRLNEEAIVKDFWKQINQMAKNPTLTFEPSLKEHLAYIITLLISTMPTPEVIPSSNPFVQQCTKAAQTIDPFQSFAKLINLRKPKKTHELTQTQIRHLSHLFIAGTISYQATTAERGTLLTNVLGIQKEGLTSICHRCLLQMSSPAYRLTHPNVGPSFLDLTPESRKVPRQQFNELRKTLEKKTSFRLPPNDSPRPLTFYEEVTKYLITFKLHIQTPQGQKEFRTILPQSIDLLYQIHAYAVTQEYATQYRPQDCIIFSQQPQGLYDITDDNSLQGDLAAKAFRQCVRELTATTKEFVSFNFIDQAVEYAIKQTDQALSNFFRTLSTIQVTPTDKAFYYRCLAPFAPTLITKYQSRLGLNPTQYQGNFSCQETYKWLKTHHAPLFTKHDFLYLCLSGSYLFSPSPEEKVALLNLLQDPAFNNNSFKQFYHQQVNQCSKAHCVLYAPNKSRKVITHEETKELKIALRHRPENLINYIVIYFFTPEQDRSSFCIVPQKNPVVSKIEKDFLAMIESLSTPEIKALHYEHFKPSYIKFKRDGEDYWEEDHYPTHTDWKQYPDFELYRKTPLFFMRRLKHPSDTMLKDSFETMLQDLWWLCHQLPFMYDVRDILYQTAPQLWLAYHPEVTRPQYYPEFLSVTDSIKDTVLQQPDSSTEQDLTIAMKQVFGDQSSISDQNLSNFGVNHGSELNLLRDTLIKILAIPNHWSKADVTDKLINIASDLINRLGGFLPNRIPLIVIISSLCPHPLQHATQYRKYNSRPNALYELQKVKLLQTYWDPTVILRVILGNTIITPEMKFLLEQAYLKLGFPIQPTITMVTSQPKVKEPKSKKSKKEKAPAAKKQQNLDLIYQQEVQACLEEFAGIILTGAPDLYDMFVVYNISLENRFGHFGHRVSDRLAFQRRYANAHPEFKLNSPKNQRRTTDFLRPLMTITNKPETYLDLYEVIMWSLSLIKPMNDTARKALDSFRLKLQNSTYAFQRCYLLSLTEGEGSDIFNQENRVIPFSYLSQRSLSSGSASASFTATAYFGQESQARAQSFQTPTNSYVGRARMYSSNPASNGRRGIQTPFPYQVTHKAGLLARHLATPGISTQPSPSNVWTEERLEALVNRNTYCTLKSRDLSIRYQIKESLTNPYNTKEKVIMTNQVQDNGQDIVISVSQMFLDNLVTLVQDSEAQELILTYLLLVEVVQSQCTLHNKALLPQYDHEQDSIGFEAATHYLVASWFGQLQFNQIIELLSKELNQTNQDVTNYLAIQKTLSVTTPATEKRPLYDQIRAGTAELPQNLTGWIQAFQQLSSMA